MLLPTGHTVEYTVLNALPTLQAEQAKLIGETMEEQKKNPAQGLSESEQVQVRRQKLADLQAAGQTPLP